MAALGQLVTVGTSPTLLFEVLDSASLGVIPPPTSTPTPVFYAQSSADPLPIMLIFSSTNTIFLGGANVASTGTHIGALATGLSIMTYNCVGGDSLYGIVGSATQPVQVLALRQP